MVGVQSTLRERTRQAVRHDITKVAVDLFLEHGYDSTTIDDIARAVGMSQRSVFRYFPTKEDIVVGKFSRGAEDMLGALRARPASESAWESLRRMFDVLDSPSDSEETRRVQEMVFATPALLSVYLRALHDLQDAVVTVLLNRAAADDECDVTDPAPRALVAAAFGCLTAAQQTSLNAKQDDTALTLYLDRAMNALISLDIDSTK